MFLMKRRKRVVEEPKEWWEDGYEPPKPQQWWMPVFAEKLMAKVRGLHVNIPRGGLRNRFVVRKHTVKTAGMSKASMVKSVSAILLFCFYAITLIPSIHTHPTALPIIIFTLVILLDYIRQLWRRG